LSNSNKITFRNLNNEPPTLSKHLPVVEPSSSPSPQAHFDLNNFNAFTGGHHLAVENKRRKNNDSDDEFARGESIPISETLRKEINFIKDANRYMGNEER